MASLSIFQAVSECQMLKFVLSIDKVLYFKLFSLDTGQMGTQSVHDQVSA